jgi:RNA polymerase sigma factor (sigma-70 family)
MKPDQDQQIVEAISRDRARLRSFIRSRVEDARDAEDILQDVFYKLVEANRLLVPLEQITAWLFRVARNRIIDLSRKHREEPLPRPHDDEPFDFDDLLPSLDAQPDVAYARAALLQELERAIGELPPEQREVFVAHELDGETFQEMSARTGISINTLLSRKRYAVLRLRERLKAAYDDFNK